MVYGIPNVRRNRRPEPHRPAAPTNCTAPRCAAFRSQKIMNATWNADKNDNWWAYVGASGRGQLLSYVYDKCESASEELGGWCCRQYAPLFRVPNHSHTQRRSRSKASTFSYALSFAKNWASTEYLHIYMSVYVMVYIWIIFIEQNTWYIVGYL